MGEFRETRRTAAESGREGPGVAAGTPRPRRSSKARRRWPAVTTATMCRRPPHRGQTSTSMANSSTGDSYDNALAETVIGLFKTEEIHRRGPWKGLDDVEFATLEWVAWYNGSRLLAPLGYVPPAEFEQAYHDRHSAPAEPVVLN